MLFEQGQRVVFIGDSITDCGRRDAFFPLGNGYVSMVANLVTAKYPGLGVDVINKGIAGNTVVDLENRWDLDALGENPDWLSIKIGINDVWKTYARAGHPLAVPLDLYEQTYRKLLKTTKERSDCKIIIIEPFLIEPDLDDEMRGHAADYADVARELAGEFATIHLKTQDLIDRLLASTVPTNLMTPKTDILIWGSDRVDRKSTRLNSSHT